MTREDFRRVQYSESMIVEVEVKLRPTVSRPVRPGVRHPSRTRGQFFPFCLWLFFWRFRICWCGAPSLTRSWVSTFQFLPGIASAAFQQLGWVEFILRLTVSRPVRLGIGFPVGPMTRLYPYPFFKAPSLTRGRVCNLQCNHWLVRSLRTNNHTLPSHQRLCSLFVVSYDSQGLRWRYSNPPSHGVIDDSSNIRDYIATVTIRTTMSVIKAIISYLEFPRRWLWRLFSATRPL
jgi:hypothetical protein